MAPLTRSVYYKLPEIPLEAPRVESKDVQASSHSITLANVAVPRLVTYKSKSGSCFSCSNMSTQACADCHGMVFYCDADCQTAHWPEHRNKCPEIKDQYLIEVMEARDKRALNQITEDIGKIISSDFKSLDYKDTKLSVKIDASASFGDFYDVGYNSDRTIRSFLPGTYKCTSVNLDVTCAPVTIFHHESVDPAKVTKQCILMSKDFFYLSDLPNQVSMPEWCNWESADEEYIVSDSESEASDYEASESDLIFADFVGRVFDDTSVMASDTEDEEYDASDSESECGSSDESVSDHEFSYLIDEGKQYITDIPQKRQSIAPTADMKVAVDEDREDSEAEAYKDFKEKVLESEHKYTSDIDDSDYLPYSDSDSDSGESIPVRDISDSEKCISDNEVEVILESSKDLKDMDEEMYDDFVDDVLDKFYTEESDTDAEDQDYTPADVESASSTEEEISDIEENALLEESRNLIKNLPVKRISLQTEFCSSESDTASEVSSEGELYEDFKIHTEAKHDLSDTEGLEYIPELSNFDVSSNSSYDEMEISDAESEGIVAESKDDVKEVSGKNRKCLLSENNSQDSDNEAEMESEDEALYTEFRSKLIVTDPSKVEDLGGSDDEEFLPPTESEDESQDDGSQDDGSQVSDSSDDEMDVSDTEIKDLEFSLEDKLYEEFKDEVCNTQRKVQAQSRQEVLKICDNAQLIYFMNSQYGSSFRDALENDNFETGSEIAQSYLLKNGSETFCIAVEMKGRNWRSAHAFEDATSGKCFALVVSTDTLEHISNNHEHLEAHYPDQKWSSVSETELKFQLTDFVL